MPLAQEEEPLRVSAGIFVNVSAEYTCLVAKWKGFLALEEG